MDIKETIKKNKIIFYAIGGVITTAAVVAASYFTNSSLLKGDVAASILSCTGTVTSQDQLSNYVEWKSVLGTVLKKSNVNGALTYTWSDNSKGLYFKANNNSAAGTTILYPYTLTEASAVLTVFDTGTQMAYKTSCKVTLPPKPAVAKAATTTKILATPTIPKVGEKITFTATVSSTSSQKATGNVSFTDGTTSLGTKPLDSSGKATLDISTLTSGSHGIKANYGGDTTHVASSSSSLRLSVVTAPKAPIFGSTGITEITEAPTTVGDALDSPTTITLASSSSSPKEGDDVTFTATVTSTSTQKPSGNVVFKDGASDIGADAIDSNGKATISISNITAGTHTIKASFAGGTSFKSSVSTPLQLTVTKAEVASTRDTATTLVTSDSTSDEGDAVTFSVTVEADDNGTPTGTVSLVDSENSASDVTTLKSGKAVFSINDLSVGTHQMIAIYNGDANYDSSNSDAVIQVVKKSTISEENTNNPTTQSPDILACELDRTKVARTGEGNLDISCKLKNNSKVNAIIAKGAYSGQAITDDQLVKFLLQDKTFSVNTAGSWENISIPSWNFKDKNNQLVDPGVYSFIVFAQIGDNYLPDVSAHNFTVTDFNGQDPESNPVVLQLSQCPGVYLPTDIENHWARTFIIDGYNRCLFRGYEDHTFRPDEPISRAEAFVMDLNAAGIPPHENCYDAHCGANYQVKIWKDITEVWQGRYIRAARDEGVASGYPNGTFHPNELINRAEAAALISKTKQFNLPPHKGCYTANCGAGYPDNLFQDIFQFWQGQFIRPLAEKGLIVGVAPGIFEPDRPITRAEMAKILLKASEQRAK